MGINQSTTVTFTVSTSLLPFYSVNKIKKIKIRIHVVVSVSPIADQ